MKKDYNKTLEKSGFREKIKYIYTINKILLNAYVQENLYGLTLHTVDLSQQMLERPC